MTVLDTAYQTLDPIGRGHLKHDVYPLDGSVSPRSWIRRGRTPPAG